MKRTIITFSLIVNTLLCFSQQKETPGVAYPSSDGIFIYNFFKPASAKKPNASGATGFRVERSVNKGAFATIIERSTPSNQLEFERNLKEGKTKVPFPLREDQYNKQLIWLSYSKCNCFDSLTYEIAFLDMQMAFSLLFKDEKVEKGNTYQYRVSQIDKDGKNINSVTSMSVAYPVASGFSKPVAYSRKEMRNNVRITWYSVRNPPVKPTTFMIYRSSITSGFERLDITPFITEKGDTMFYDIADDDVTEETYYYYYISPTNYWGIRDVVSDTAEAFTLPLGDILLPQFFRAVADSTGKAIRLSWRVYKPSLIGAVQIWRSSRYDVGYEQIGSASSTDTGYTDLGIEPGMKHYYYLTFSDRLLRQSLNSPRVFGLYQTAEKPPSVMDVTAVRKDEITTIQWKSRDENVTGFYVYRCQGTDGELKPISHFIRRTSVDSTMTFIDKDSLNAKYLYGYCVKQENTSYVQGNCSQLAYVQGTYKATLTAPLNPSVSPVSNGLMIFWEDMRDANPQLMGYNLYFESENGLLKVNTDLIPSHLSNYTDTLAKPGFIYRYRLECIGTGGNKSNMTDLLTYTWRGPDLTPVSGLAAWYAEDQVILKFNPAFDTRIKKFQLYRYERGTEPVMLADLPSGSDTYEDHTVQKGKLYFYFMVATDAAGNVSAKSKEVSVETE